MEISELVKIVDELNETIHSHDEESCNTFSFMSNGYIESISFNDHILWDSENDGRIFIEKENDYEPLINFVKRQYNNYVDELMLYYFIN